MNKSISQILSSIQIVLQNARKSVLQAVNTTMVYTYFEIGRMIVEHEQGGNPRAEYGMETLKFLSQELTKEFGKGFSVTNLKQMKSFFLIYTKGQTLPDLSSNIEYFPENKEKSLTITAKSEQKKLTLSWSHYVFLMRIKNETERNFYETESQINNWSLRELSRQFDSALFERVALSRDKKGVLEENLKKYHIPENPQDTLKDPYILEFLGLEENKKYSESDLEQKIIDHLEYFLLELGKGFAFIGRQQRFTFDEKHFFVDLVFYNRLLKCFVIIDLKLGEIKHQDLGQMQMYVNYYDRFVKTEEENKTIGILLSKNKNETLVEITLPENSNIFSKEYQLYLPTKEELKKQLDKETV